MRLPRPLLVARLLRGALLVFFLWLVARHWDHHHGFTRFLQADADVAARIVPALQDAPIYVHPGPGSYDGFYYAEIATDPTLRDPTLAPAVDDLGYRARRILLGALAWTLGRGEPVAVVHVYAWLNVVAWFLLAALLWRLFPCNEWRATVAWAGVLFATGTLLSVRLALTDLPALLLTAAALTSLERQPSQFPAAVWLGLAGLARETALLGLAAFVPTGKTERRFSTWAAVGLALIPLLLWLAYLRFTVGGSGQGLGNFTWPLLGLLKKAGALLAAWRSEPGSVLVIGSLLAHLALLIQLIYLLGRSSPREPWWRLGAAFGALLLCLGPAVWGDDLPGAAVRVLLPLVLAFNVLAVRRRAAAAWLILGNLSVLGGVAALWAVPRDAHEFATGRHPTGTYAVHLGGGFYATEHGRKSSWAWCNGSGSLRIDLWPHDRPPRQLALDVRAFTFCEVEIFQDDTLLWRGPVDRNTRWIELARPIPRHGRLDLRIHTSTPPSRESVAAGGRDLAFSLNGVRLDGAE